MLFRSPNGALNYTVRIESLAPPGTQSLPYAFTIDSVAPSQTISVAVTTSAGVTIASNSSTDDALPIVKVTLSSALNSSAGTTESLVITRVLSGGATGSTVISPTLTSCTVTLPCLQFTDSPSVATFTQPANGVNSALPITVQYNVVVRDQALNSSAATGAFTFKFDYLSCLQSRADAARPGHTLISYAAAAASAAASGMTSTTNCQGCHSSNGPGPGIVPTPAGTLVPVPASLVTPRYWCRRPS